MPSPSIRIGSSVASVNNSTCTSCSHWPPTGPRDCDTVLSSLRGMRNCQWYWPDTHHLSRLCSDSKTQTAKKHCLDNSLGYASRYKWSQTGASAKHINFSQFWRMEIWVQGASMVGSWWRCPSWLPDDHLLTVSWHSTERASLFSSCKAPITTVGPSPQYDLI